jgi:nucleoside-diphosphate-sugar epimerase
MRYLVTGGAGFIGSHLVERPARDDGDRRPRRSFDRAGEHLRGVPTASASSAAA